MHGNFSGRQAEDQPSASYVDVGESEHVLEKCAVFLRARAVDNRVGSGDHGSSPRVAMLPQDRLGRWGGCLLDGGFGSCPPMPAQRPVTLCLLNECDDANDP